MSKVTIVRAADYAELSEFHSAFPGDIQSPTFWEQRFRCWWDDNPAFDEGVVRGWIVRGQTGEIGGFLGNVPSLFRIGGKDRRVFSATTWRVLPEHRSASIHLYLAHMEAGAGCLLFNTTASSHTFPMLEYLRYRSLASSVSGRTFFVAVNTKSVMAAYLHGRKFPVIVKLLARAALMLAQFPLQVMMAIKRGDQVKVLPEADATFDELWERTRGMYDNVSVRTAAQINWLCFSNPKLKKTLIGCYQNGKLRGFAIFSDSQRRGTKALELCDIWSEVLGDDATSSLLVGAWDHAKRHNYDVIVFRDYCTALSSTFRKLGFLLTAGDTSRIFYRPTDSAAMDFSRSDSYFSSLEGDRVL